MSFRILLDGSILCETVDEAIAFLVRLRTMGLVPPLNIAVYGAMTFAETAAVVAAEEAAISSSPDKFLRALNRNQRRALMAIQKAEHLTLDDLTRAIEQASNQGTGGVVAGIVRLAERFQVSVSSLFVKTTKPSTENPREAVTVYTSGPLLRTLTIPEPSTTGGRT